MSSEITTKLSPEMLALLPPEMVSTLDMLTLPVLLATTLLFSVPFALAGFWVARKRGLNVRYWTLLGLVLGPLVLPFLLFARKKSSN